MAIEYLVSPASQSLACHQWLHTAKGVYTRDQLLTHGLRVLSSSGLHHSGLPAPFGADTPYPCYAAPDLSLLQYSYESRILGVENLGRM